MLVVFQEQYTAIKKQYNNLMVSIPHKWVAIPYYNHLFHCSFSIINLFEICVSLIQMHWIHIYITGAYFFCPNCFIVIFIKFWDKLSCFPYWLWRIKKYEVFWYDPCLISACFTVFTGQLKMASPLPEQPAWVHAGLHQRVGLPGRRAGQDQEAGLEWPHGGPARCPQAVRGKECFGHVKGTPTIFRIHFE